MRRFILAGLLLCSSASLAFAAAGDLDLTFAGTGKTRFGFGGGDDNVNGMVIQTDGKIVVAATSYSSRYVITLARYNTDGSRDGTFGVGGRVVTSLGASCVAADIAILSDGKFIVAGNIAMASPGLSDYLLLRYNSDGSLDTSFDGDGYVITNVTNDVSTNDTASAMVVQGDGNIIVIGRSAMLRYLPSGGLDPAFGGGDGIVTFSGPIYHDLTLQSDGKIIAVGQLCVGFPIATCGVQITRFNTDGVGDGTAFQSPAVGSFATANAVAIQAGGIMFGNPDKIVMVGVASGGSFVVRYNLDGTLDTGFNGNGTLQLSDSGGAFAIGFQLNVSTQAANRILVAGQISQVNTGVDFYVMRLNVSNGTMDTTFDGDGIAVTPMTTFSDGVRVMVLRSGIITVAGACGVGANVGGDVGLARYIMSTGALDATLDGDGIKLDDLTDFPARARGVGYQSSGKMIVAGYVPNAVEFAVARLNPNGSLDSSFGVGGETVAPGAIVVNAVTIQPDDKIILAGTNSTGGGAFLMTRFTADGQIDAALNGDGNNDGQILTTMGTSNSTAYAVAVQSDGKIILAGEASNGSNIDFAIARFDNTGAPDSSFDVDGKLLTPIGSGADLARTIAIQPDGKILVGGYYSNGSNDDFAIVRYLINGGLDFSFSADGKQQTAIGPGNDQAFAVALQSDGKIVLAGASFSGVNNDFALVRYLSNGTPDNLFDGDGKLTAEIGAEDSACAVRVLPDGKIIAAGYSFTGVTNDFAAARYTTTGAPDTTFGTNGQVIVDLASGTEDFGYAMAIDAIGRVTVVGDSGDLFGVARFLGDPLLKVTSIARNGTTVMLQGLGVPGLTNHIDTSLDLSPNSFSLAMNVTPDVNGFWQQPLSSSATKQFYRLSFP